MEFKRFSMQRHAYSFCLFAIAWTIHLSINSNVFCPSKATSTTLPPFYLYMQSVPYTFSDVKQCFHEYFKDHMHIAVPAAPLVTKEDSKLLFTNAGMLQFKDIFMGTQIPSHKRIITCQPCIRAGGKHNDLENVGYTKRHLTYFEMLGNFSFNDYFKKEAILYAWKFLVDVLKIPERRLFVTVHSDDTESYRIWNKDIGIPHNRILSHSSQNNLWFMDSIGPCGYCTEIYYCQQDEHQNMLVNNTSHKTLEEGFIDSNRYLELWNIVFIQFYRQHDGSLSPLKTRSVDTGMGLERVVSVMQNVQSNFDIDLFVAIKSNCLQILGISSELRDSSLSNIIADHIRSSCSIIAEDVLPSNTGRGYVLRRLIRRGCRSGIQLSGRHKPFFYSLVKCFIQTISDPKMLATLQSKQAFIETVILKEEMKFIRLLKRGMRLLHKEIEATQKLPSAHISGELAFRLYDTFGFPIEVTKDIANEEGIPIDMDAYTQLMNEQRQRGKSALLNTLDELEKS